MPRYVFRPNRLHKAGSDLSGLVAIITNISEVGLEWKYHYTFSGKPSELHLLARRVAEAEPSASSLVKDLTDTMVMVSQLGGAQYFSGCYDFNSRLNPYFPGDLSVDIYSAPKAKTIGGVHAHDFFITEKYFDRYDLQIELESRRN